jgi:hypothetical protein
MTLESSATVTRTQPHRSTRKRTACRALVQCRTEQTLPRRLGTVRVELHSPRRVSKWRSISRARRIYAFQTGKTVLQVSLPRQWCDMKRRFDTRSLSTEVFGRGGLAMGICNGSFDFRNSNRNANRIPFLRVHEKRGLSVVDSTPVKISFSAGGTKVAIHI